MRNQRWATLAACLMLAAAAMAQQSAPSAEPSPNDYSDPDAWLCRPGRQDACAVDMTTTVITAQGELSTETWSADPDAPIDCFYVYPTVSTDTTPNSDMTADPAELNVIRQQFARFASKCRPYAPLYRQVTLAGLRQVLAGAASLEQGLQYDDVLDAWNYYLEHDNQGRGFVLVGHSQGSFILAELIAREIDGKPVADRMVSAILPGATIQVEKGQDTGGKFQRIPVCRAASQTGCVIAYSAFRSTVPPPEDSLFGRPGAEDTEAACVNPAELSGGRGGLHAYLSATGRTITSTSSLEPWVMPEKAIGTPWVSVPGLLTARCASNEYANYLEVTVHGDPSDPRVDDISGDLGAGGRILANWGLHLIDVNLAMGDLVEIVGGQAKAWLAKHPR